VAALAANNQAQMLTICGLFAELVSRHQFVCQYDSMSLRLGAPFMAADIP
jgi:hypothetical protein